MRTIVLSIAAIAACAALLAPATASAQPEPSLKAVYHFDFAQADVDVGGASWTPGATIDLQVLDGPGGTVRWSGSTTANAGDVDWLDVGSFDDCCSRGTFGFLLAPGMQLRATDTTTGVVKELTLVPLTIDEVDPTDDSVSGTAPPGASVRVEVEGQRAESVAADDGAWRVQFDPAVYRLGWTSRVEASTLDPDGDWTGAAAQPPTISVDLLRDTICGTYFSLGGDRLVEVLRAGGTPVWSTTAPAGDARALDVTAGVDLLPGMEVQVTDETTGVVKAVTLVPLTVEVADPVANRAGGTGPPGVSTGIFAWWEGLGGGMVGWVVPDAAGVWSYQFPAESAILPSTSVSANVADAEADVTTAGYVPPTEAIPALEQELAAAVPETAAKPLVEKLESALASLGGTGGVVTTATASGGSDGSGKVNVRAALGKLGAFVNQVEGLVKAHRLAPETGSRLAAAATRILVGLGG